MTVRVLLTGAYGTVGTAVLDHLDEDGEYEFTCLNRSDRPPEHPYGEYETVVADVGDYEAIYPAFDGQDAVVHLAGYPGTGGSWEQIAENNVQGAKNVFEAASDAEVETIVFASTNHVMGGYEAEHAPELYRPGYDLRIDASDPVRPDSYYGVSKSFGEDLGRHYVENHEYPKRFVALRICSVRTPEYDHPYGDAERGVEDGRFERGDAEYDRAVARMKGMWQSRRDCAHQIDCALRSDVTYGIYSGVSDNDRRWFSIEDARTELGYRPRDNAEEWTGPPG